MTADGAKKVRRQKMKQHTTDLPSTQESADVIQRANEIVEHLKNNGLSHSWEMKSEPGPIMAIFSSEKSEIAEGFDAESPDPDPDADVVFKVKRKHKRDEPKY